jgi:hypothetical protein
VDDAGNAALWCTHRRLARGAGFGTVLPRYGDSGTEGHRYVAYELTLVGTVVPSSSGHDSAGTSWLTGVRASR